jgi:ABC-type anion transport system duplicated permease subunit
MDFWQIIAVCSMALAFAISLLEVAQVYIQRKLISEIRDKLAVIDMDAMITRTEKVTQAGLEALQRSLVEVLEPIRDKVVALKPEALIESTVDNLVNKLDVKALADTVADVMIARANEAIPQIVEQAKLQVVEGTPGAEQALSMMGMFEDNPLLGMIASAAMQRIQAPGAQQQQQASQSGGKRVI